MTVNEPSPSVTPHNPLVDIIQNNATGPAKASGDSGSVELRMGFTRTGRNSFRR